MTDLQLHIKTCPYCGNTPSIEKSIYYPDGRAIPKDAPHDLWLAKCYDCAVRTEYQPTRLSAIIAWNRGQFNKLSYIATKPRNTDDPETWTNLGGAVFRTAFDDYKLAVKGLILQHRNESNLEGDHWLAQQNEYLKRRAWDEARYDIWRDRMDCMHCPAKESECEHKYGNLYLQFKHGTAPDCVRDELLAKLKRT